MVLVVGHEGNMGKRYCAVLRQLGVEHTGIDVRSPNYQDIAEDAICGADKIIVATPTPRHLETIQAIGKIRLKKAMPTAHVLCEKPLVTRLDEFIYLRKEQSLGILKLFCVNQYAHHPQYDIFSRSTGRTYYNYFKHGDDGLVWDCFQLFVLAKGNVGLNNQSPVWTCRINGTTVSISGMDTAYVKMVEDFVGPMRRVWDLDTAEVGTKRVLKWMAEEEQDILESQNRD